MAIVEFFAKPGCISNARQKKLLQDAGHEVIEHNLVAEPWDAGRLKRFFGDAPMTEWFNPSAKAMKLGLIIPECLTEGQALRLLAADPMLIRRPLLQVGERCEAGFDPVRINAWIGLDAKGATQEELETCHRSGFSRPMSADANPAGESHP
jgi:nitrogenase-associated protein